MSGDHAEFMAFARRILRAASRRMAEADPEDLADLVALRAVVDEAIDNAARAVHASGASWGQIGAAVGTSRQAAQQRWGVKA
jgi:anti-sigma regulatory factor (Ser/Thr protein kinase)